MTDGALQLAASNEVRALIGPGADVDDAVARGQVSRLKLHGRWLYFDPDVDLEFALDHAEQAIGSCLREWLIGHNPYLAGAAVKRYTLAIGRGAFDLLLRELAQRDRLRTVALANASYQPYLAYYLQADADDIDAQIATMFDVVAKRGWIGRRDFRAPVRAVSGKAWRDVLLRHGEWLGLGFLDDEGDLVGWAPAPS